MSGEEPKAIPLRAAFGSYLWWASALLLYRWMIIDRARPEVSDQDENDTPAGGEERAVAERGAKQQAAQRVDSGREGLVLGEPANSGWHGVRADKCAAGESQELEHEGEAIGTRRRFAYQPERHSHPGDRDGDERNEAERRDPGDGTRSGPEAHKQRDSQDRDNCDHGPNKAAEGLAD